ncbi:MAG: C40 family peptidase [Candidatus Zixiibacteriota bacterium]|nr:MAG: C40 family peptidase [candidate division Zixibacteria bacterium]
MERILARKWLVSTALAYLGTPYVWGGDDPSGFDCSGFVVECLKSAGVLGEKEDHTADGLLRLFATRLVDKPRKGALLFFLNARGKAVHVAICLDGFFQVGASGGCAATSNSAAAWKANAYVKIRPISFNAASMRVVNLF